MISKNMKSMVLIYDYLLLPKIYYRWVYYRINRILFAETFVTYWTMGPIPIIFQFGKNVKYVLWYELKQLCLTHVSKTT